ncbi:acetolactate synthase [Shewanella colwelliana]|uniref:Acetolactate synthase n=1 Tax=Shewanella colwelliana TaxID=23 RepID=A0A1E5IW11_SHECO|nr:acetolactate synthase 2 small subunit [Shewanella colwelliana]MDX1283132.1 acetolactate synthase 2 small subunit [Shewanella colwelliana]OEG74769.1 acetolactate synthase [Shewanella colwelliana]GIU20628.1 acetolactate synthase [Shewanella colwelliana]GIU46224.1 acetolactate synthase [Shewanella colwelliana]
MIYNLALTLVQQPEVLERVLRVTRHRGFKITELGMQLDANGDTKLDMVVESERALEQLSHQLNKLIDVTECKVVSTKQLTQTANA